MMKNVFKKTLLFLLMATIAFSCVSCGGSSEQGQTGSSSESESSQSSPETETKTEFYDDGGAYDAIVDDEEYTWSDSAGALDGAFSDGEAEKSYLAHSETAIENGSAKAYYDLGDDVHSPASISYVAGNKLVSDPLTDGTVKSGVLGSHDGDTAYAVSESNYLVVENVEKRKNLRVSLQPQCSLADFLEADYLKFYMCLYNAPTDSGSSANTPTVYFKGSPVHRIFRCTWYEMKISLEAWRDTSAGSSYSNKEALYKSLKGEETPNDRMRGIFLQIVTSYEVGDERNSYTAYISDVTIGVDEVEEDLGRSWTYLTEEATYNDKELPCNAYSYWGTSSKVKRIDEEGLSRNMLKFTYGFDGGNVVVIPKKKLSQIMQYDYVYVTLYVETDNPYPIEIGMNGYYNVNYNKLYKYDSRIDHYRSIVSANKWVTVKFPVAAIARLYARMTANRWYTVAEDSRTFQYEGVSLFYVNGKYITTQDETVTMEKYGFTLYLSRVFLVKETLG